MTLQLNWLDCRSGAKNMFELEKAFGINLLKIIFLPFTVLGLFTFSGIVWNTPRKFIASHCVSVTIMIINLFKPS
jgi:hypothetical protein